MIVLNNNEIDLAKEINSSFKKIGFVSKNDKITAYFIKQNIEKTLGKNNFLPNEIDIMTGISSIWDYTKIPSSYMKTHSLRILYNNEKYKLFAIEDGSHLKMVNQDGLEVFSIKQYPNVIIDTLTTYSDIITSETKAVGIGEKLFFDYKKKEQNCNGEELSYEARRLTPLHSKIGSKEIFSLEFMDRTNYDKQTETGTNSFYKFLQKYKQFLENKKKEKMISIPTTYELTDMFSLLPQIYEILENQEEKSLTRERIKK